MYTGFIDLAKKGNFDTGYSTMRLGGETAYVTEIHSRDDVKEAFQWATEQHLPMLMIGGGSNILWRDKGFPGLIMVNRILGYEDYTSSCQPGAACVSFS